MKMGRKIQTLHHLKTRIFHKNSWSCNDDANTGRDFLSGNFGSSISSIISGKMAIKKEKNNNKR